MEVRFFATLRAIVGARSIEVPLAPGADAQALLDAILTRFPALEAELLDDTGALLRRVHLMINGRSVAHLEHGLATRLAGDETIDVFPAVGGG